MIYFKLLMETSGIRQSEELQAVSSFTAYYKLSTVLTFVLDICFCQILIISSLGIPVLFLCTSHGEVSKVFAELKIDETHRFQFQPISEQLLCQRKLEWSGKISNYFAWLLSAYLTDSYKLISHLLSVLQLQLSVSSFFFVLTLYALSAALCSYHYSAVHEENYLRFKYCFS